MQIVSSFSTLHNPLMMRTRNMKIEDIVTETPGLVTSRQSINPNNFRAVYTSQSRVNMAPDCSPSDSSIAQDDRRGSANPVSAWKPPPRLISFESGSTEPSLSEDRTRIEGHEGIPSQVATQFTNEPPGEREISESSHNSSIPATKTEIPGLAPTSSGFPRSPEVTREPQPLENVVREAIRESTDSSEPSASMPSKNAGGSPKTCTLRSKRSYSKRQVTLSKVQEQKRQAPLEDVMILDSSPARGRPSSTEGERRSSQEQKVGKDDAVTPERPNATNPLSTAQVKYASTAQELRDQDITQKLGGYFHNPNPSTNSHIPAVAAGVNSRNSQRVEFPSSLPMTRGGVQAHSFPGNGRELLKTSSPENASSQQWKKRRLHDETGGGGCRKKHRPAVSDMSRSTEQLGGIAAGHVIHQARKVQPEKMPSRHPQPTTSVISRPQQPATCVTVTGAPAEAQKITSSPGQPTSPKVSTMVDFATLIEYYGKYQDAILAESRRLSHKAQTAAHKAREGMNDDPIENILFEAWVPEDIARMISPAPIEMLRTNHVERKLYRVEMPMIRTNKGKPIMYQPQYHRTNPLRGAQPRTVQTPAPNDPRTGPRPVRNGPQFAQACNSIQQQSFKPSSAGPATGYGPSPKDPRSGPRSMHHDHQPSQFYHVIGHQSFKASFTGLPTVQTPAPNDPRTGPRPVRNGPQFAQACNSIQQQSFKPSSAGPATGYGPSPKDPRSGLRPVYDGHQYTQTYNPTQPCS